MKSIINVRSLSLCLALASLPVAAQAADGSFCYSSVFTSTSSSASTTTNFPQLTNDTKFTCANPAFQYTMRQLSQAGWIIDNVGSTILSTTTTVNGSNVTVTTQTRYLLTIQK